MSIRKEYIEEENLNVISHGVGLLLSIVGLYFLLEKSIKNPDKLFFICALIYGLSLTFMYLCSTLYHYYYNTKYKNSLRLADHISIYFLIAGSYTPGLLLKLNEGLGVYLFFLVWGIAIFGMFFKIFFLNKFEKFSLALYLIMGWLIVVDFNSLITYFNSDALLLMILGGVLYTVGTIFYSLEKIKYNHAIWHLFVLAGSASHYFMIYKYII